MTVIAMTREMGSLGKDVASGIAEALGLEVIHHELIEREVASRLHVGESDVHRFLEGKPSLWHRWRIDDQRLSRFTSEEILELAAKGDVVIRGWGAAALLKPVRHVLRVRVCAPLGFRVEVLKERLRLQDDDLARREIERNDAAHTRTLHRLFDADWRNPLNYDIVLNTQRLPVEDCVAQLELLARSAAFAQTKESVVALKDLIVETRVRNTLAQSKEIGGAARYVDITVGKGEVVLSGAVGNKATSDSVHGLVRSVRGVRSVANNLVVSPNRH